MKDKTGYTYEENGRLYARLTYTDETGKRRNVKRRANNTKHAKAILKDLREQFDKGGALVRSMRRTGWKRACVKSVP